MKAALVSFALASGLAAAAIPAHALDVRSMKEDDGPAALGGPCALSVNTNGSAANFRWYNICSGYVWIFSDWDAGEGVGVLFGGPQQLEVNSNNDIKRVITYYRNVMTNYQQGVDIHIDYDFQGDGCPDGTIASDLALDPGLRWNCSDFNANIPLGVNYVIVRQVHGGGAMPAFATDGRKSAICSPAGPARSFYYGVNGAACLPWDGPTARDDNFLTWLILDGFPSPQPQACCFHAAPCQDLEPSLCVTLGGTPFGVGSSCQANDCAPTPVPEASHTPSSWGAVKGLFR